MPFSSREMCETNLLPSKLAIVTQLVCGGEDCTLAALPFFERLLTTGAVASDLYFLCTISMHHVCLHFLAQETKKGHSESGLLFLKEAF